MAEVDMAADEVDENSVQGTTVQNETLYINNLNERVPLTQLKAELLTLCNEYGPVRDIVARKSLRKRGQAFVVFDSVDSAARALPHLHNKEWHSKPMRATYARNKSDLHVPEEKLKVRKQKRDSVKHLKKKAGTIEVPSQPPSAVPQPAVDRGEPNSVLFLEQIPDVVTPDSLQDIFKPVPGFVEARMFAIKHLGFVEFESVEAAAAALDHWTANIGSVPNVGKMAFAKK